LSVTARSPGSAKPLVILLRTCRAHNAHTSHLTWFEVLQRKARKVLAATRARETAKARRREKIKAAKQEFSNLKRGVATKEKVFKDGFYKHYGRYKREKLDANQDTKPKTTCSVRLPLLLIEMYAVALQVIEHEKIPFSYGRSTSSGEHVRIKGGPLFRQLRSSGTDHFFIDRDTHTTFPC
jgi:hypothetical protein